MCAELAMFVSLPLVLLMCNGYCSWSVLV